MTTLIRPPNRPRINPGICGTVWSDAGIMAAVRDARTRWLYPRALPQIVGVHSGLSDLRANVVAAIAAMRALVPNCRVWVGIGCDGLVAQVGQGQLTPQAAAQQLFAVCKAAYDAGAEMAMPDLESTPATYKAAAAAMLGEWYSLMWTNLPNMAIAITTWDQPGVHGGFPFVASIGRYTADYYQPMIYPGTGGSIPRGALQAEWQTSATSVAGAVAAGLIEQWLPVLPYFLEHSVPVQDTVNLGSQCYALEMWTCPGECDQWGVTAFWALCELARRGMNVAEFQASPEGQGTGAPGFGPLVAAALKVPYPVTPWPPT